MDATQYFGCWKWRIYRGFSTKHLSTASGKRWQLNTVGWCRRSSNLKLLWVASFIVVFQPFCEILHHACCESSEIWFAQPLLLPLNNPGQEEGLKKRLHESPLYDNYFEALVSWPLKTTYREDSDPAKKSFKPFYWRVQWSLGRYSDLMVDWCYRLMVELLPSTRKFPLLSCSWKIHTLESLLASIHQNICFFLDKEFLFFEQMAIWGTLKTNMKTLKYVGGFNIIFSLQKEWFSGFMLVFCGRIDVFREPPDPGTRINSPCKMVVGRLFDVGFLLGFGLFSGSGR